MAKAAKHADEHEEVAPKILDEEQPEVLETDTDEVESHDEPRLDDEQLDAVSSQISDIMKQAEAVRQTAMSKVAEIQKRLKAAQDELMSVERLLGKEPTQYDKSVVETRERIPRGFFRDKVLEILDGKPDGLIKSEIVELTGVRGDLKKEQALSAALSNMKKAGEISQNNGRYMRP